MRTLFYICSRFPNTDMGTAEFCLVDNVTPFGTGHPYTKSMLEHYERQKTPISSTKRYPNISAQRERFLSRGWSCAEAIDLWQAWSCDQFVTHDERRALDDVEPFDDWEELILFSRHSIILHAQLDSNVSDISTSVRGQGRILSAASVTKQFEIKAARMHQEKPVKRRFGSSVIVSNPEGQRYATHLFGTDPDGRATTYDLYALQREQSPFKLPHYGPSPRLCSTLTDLGDQGILLVGGCTSPKNALSDCWILSKGVDTTWRRTWDSPEPVYRHSTLRLRGTSLALTMGGRTGINSISACAFLFHPEKGWLECQVDGAQPEPTFGGSICNSCDGEGESLIFTGLMTGGMKLGGILNADAHLWKLDLRGDEVCLTAMSRVQNRQTVADRCFPALHNLQACG